MATKRIRVHEKEYELIKKLTEKEGFTQAEAVHRLIRGEYVVEGDEVVEAESSSSFGGKMFWGAVATAGAMVAKEVFDDNAKKAENISKNQEVKSDKNR